VDVPWLGSWLRHHRADACARWYGVGFLDGQWQYTRRRLDGASPAEQQAYGAGWAAADGLVWEPDADSRGAQLTETP
jgi:hypothetical protein